MNTTGGLYVVNGQRLINISSSSGVNNTFIGRGVAINNTTGYYNSALGGGALSSNTTGIYNSALGVNSLMSNTTGYENSAFGVNSLMFSTTGIGNVAMGVNAIANNTTGSRNTSTGNYSQMNSTTGNYNVSSGYQSLYGNTTGSGNAAIGYNALYGNTTGSNNSALGFVAGYQDSGAHFATLSTLQNATAIGSYAQVQQSNSIVLGSVDNATKVGIGTTVPSNTFSVSPLDYQTGTATRTNGSATLAGAGTTWTNAMVGDLIVFADGTTNTVTGFTSTTSITMGTTYAGTTDVSPVYYRFHKVGLQVTSTGAVGIGNVSPAYALDVTGDVSSNTTFRIGTTAGLSSLSCSGGQLLQNATVLGGIVTAGSCVAAGGGSGVSIVGTLDGGTYSDNGASISGSTIFLQSASASHNGLVTYGAQTFGGVKTFAAGLTVNGAFVLQEAAAPAGATGYGKLYVSSIDHNLHFVNASGTNITLGSGGGFAGTHTIKISPEFPNAVFTTGGQSNVTGFMQTDLVSGLAAGEGYKHNYYSWTTDQATSQTYDISMQYQVPSDFSSFATGSFKIWAYGTDSTKNGATVIMKDVDGTQCFSSAVTITNGTWVQTSLPDWTSGTCTIAANDLITITVRPSASSASTNETRIGEFQFGYN
jgi:hypothetical protein